MERRSRPIPSPSGGAGEKTPPLTEPGSLKFRQRERMMPTDDERAAAAALAGGAISAALLEPLMEKNLLSRNEARAVLQKALATVGAFSVTPGGQSAQGVITRMLAGKFSVRG